MICSRLLLVMVLGLIWPMINIRTATANWPDGCTKSEVSSGNLVGVGNPITTQLTTSEKYGGSPGRLVFFCQNDVSIVISSPKQVAGPIVTSTSAVGTITSSLGEQINSDSGKPSLMLKGGVDNSLSVDLNVVQNGWFVAGNYQFIVPLTFVAP